MNKLKVEKRSNMENFETKRKLYQNDLNCSIQEFVSLIEQFPKDKYEILALYFAISQEVSMSIKQIAVYCGLPLEAVENVIKESVAYLKTVTKPFTPEAIVDYQIEKFFEDFKEAEEINILDIEKLNNIIREYIPYKEWLLKKKEILNRIEKLGKTIDENRYNKERKNQLILNYQNTGDNASLTELIKMDNNYIKKFVRRFYATSMECDDLYQEAVIGYIKAVKRFNIQKGYQLTTYATKYMYSSVTRAIYNTDRMVRKPVHVEEKSTILRQYITEFIKQNHRYPNEMEIAEKLGCSLDRAKEIIKANYTVASLSEPLKTGSHKSEGDEAELQDFIEDITAIPLEEQALNTVLSSDIEMLLQKSLTSKERRIITLLYGLEDNKMRTLEETGKLEGLTRERVRQIHEKALMKMRHPRNTRRVKDFL